MKQRKPTDFWWFLRFKNYLNNYFSYYFKTVLMGAIIYFINWSYIPPTDILSGIEFNSTPISIITSKNVHKCTLMDSRFRFSFVSRAFLLVDQLLSGFWKKEFYTITFHFVDSRRLLGYSDSIFSLYWPYVVLFFHIIAQKSPIKSVFWAFEISSSNWSSL